MKTIKNFETLEQVWRECRRNSKAGALARASVKTAAVCLGQNHRIRKASWQIRKLQPTAELNAMVLHSACRRALELFAAELEEAGVNPQQIAHTLISEINEGMVYHAKWKR